MMSAAQRQLAPVLLVFGLASTALPTGALGQFLITTEAPDPRWTTTCRQRQLVIVTALGDSVDVDDGVAFEVLPWGPVDVLRGQKALIERADPPMASDTVVLVEWRGTPDSRPYWDGEGALSLEPGSRWLAGGVVRDPQHWATGLPTVDYLGGWFRDRGEQASYADTMTVDEQFDFCSMPVDLDIVRAGDWSQDIAPMAWARASGEAWRKHPAMSQLYRWATVIERARVLQLPVDVAGTYSVTVDLPSGRRLRFAFRTTDRVYGSWSGMRPYRGNTEITDPPWEFRDLGYQVRFWTARVVDDLPHVQGDPFTPLCRVWLPLERARIFGRPPPPQGVYPLCLRAMWPWEVGMPADLGDRRPGLLEPELLRHVIPHDPELSGLLDQYASSFSERWNASEEIPATGEFRSSTPGELQYRQSIVIAPDLEIRVLATRVSRDIVLESSN